MFLSVHKFTSNDDPTELRNDLTDKKIMFDGKDILILSIFMEILHEMR